jgi:hypothetical protein
VKNKPPAFQFYVRDWLASKSVRMMTPTQRGYYIQLLAEAWDSDRPGYLPEGYATWQLAGAQSEAEFLSNGGEAVLSHFTRDSKRRLFNARLLLERKKQIANSKLQREKGVAGAAKRWHRSSRGHPSATPRPSPDDGRAIPLRRQSASASTSGSSSSHGFAQESTTTTPPELLIRKLQAWRPGFDLEAITRLWAACRERSPECTPEEVLAMCDEKFKQRHNGKVPVTNWPGYLLTSVPKCFERNEATVPIEREKP